MKKIEDILAQCIEDIRTGRSSMADCLAKYPSVSKELEPLLRIALNIQELPDVKPSAAFKMRARVQLVEQIHAKQTVTKWPWSRFIHQVKPIPYKMRLNMVAIIIAVVLAVSALGGGTAYASQDSLPGDVLYPVKLGTEQARLVLAANDVDKAELYLTLANRRVGEMTALAERGRPEKVDIAVNGYDGAIAMAIGKMEEASGKGLATANISEVLAWATLQHLSTLEDEVYDKVPDEAKPAIEKAIEVSARGWENALLALAGEKPVRAMEINLAAMEGRLNRAKAKAEENDIEEVESALLEFEELHKFGEKISGMARGLSDIITLDQLIVEATSHHLEVLAEVYEKVPEQAKSAIERAMENGVSAYERAVKALEERGALGNIPEEPPIPEGIPDNVKEKISKPEPKVPGNGRR